MIQLDDVKIIAIIADKFGSSVGERYLEAIVNLTEGKVYGPRGKPQPPRQRGKKEVYLEDVDAQTEYPACIIVPLNDTLQQTVLVQIEHVKKTNEAMDLVRARDTYSVAEWIKQFRRISGMGLLEAKRTYDYVLVNDDLNL